MCQSPPHWRCRPAARRAKASRTLLKMRGLKPAAPRRGEIGTLLSQRGGRCGAYRGAHIRVLARARALSRTWPPPPPPLACLQEVSPTAPLAFRCLSSPRAVFAGFRRVVSGALQAVSGGQWA